MSNFVITTSDNGPLIVNVNDTGVGLQILCNRVHEPEVVNYGKSILVKCYELHGRGVIALDVGANIGTCAVPWARHLKDWGYLVAYEPQETIFYALAGNLVINNLMNAKAINAVVSSNNDVMQIPRLNYNMPGNYGGLHLRKQDDRGDLGQPVSYKEEHMTNVLTLTLDDQLYEIKGWVTENVALKVEAAPDVNLILGKYENEKFISYVRQKYKLPYERFVEIYDTTKHTKEYTCQICQTIFARDVKLGNKLVCSRICSGKLMAQNKKMPRDGDYPSLPI